MQKKTKRHKKNKQAHELSFNQRVASVCGCSDRYVNMVLSSDRPVQSELAQRIVDVSNKLALQDNKLVEAARELVKF